MILCVESIHFGMKKIFTREFIIGLSVIVAIAILIVGIDYLKGVNLFKPANFYYATYTDVAGLETAAPVTLNGYKVGQVREISYDYSNPGHIKVLLALNKELHIPDDSRASIGSTLLSGAFINLELGSSRKMLEVGSDIPTSASPDLMSSLTNDMMPKVNAILPRIDTLLYNLNLLVTDPALLASVRRLDGITENLLLTSGSLNNTMSRQVPSILNGAGGVIQNIDTITANLTLLSSQLKALPIQSTMNNVEQITENLSRFSRQLNDPGSSLGMLTSSPELYNRLNTVAADIDSLIVDIKKNPKRYISIKLL